jgi:hypothetical protein
MHGSKSLAGVRFIWQAVEADTMHWSRVEPSPSSLCIPWQGDDQHQLNAREATRSVSPRTMRLSSLKWLRHSEGRLEGSGNLRLQHPRRDNVPVVPLCGCTKNASALSFGCAPVRGSGPLPRPAYPWGVTGKPAGTPAALL